MIKAAEIKSRSKELAKISLPITVELLAVSLMGMVSTMLISTVGEEATSALGLVDTLSNLIIALFAALITGGTIVVAQYIGRDDVVSAKRAAGQAIVLSMAVSLVFTIVLAFFSRPILTLFFGGADEEVMSSALQFLAIVNFSFPILAATQTIFGILRGSGNTIVPMGVSIVMNLVNLGLGFTLIRGLDMGFFTIPALGITGAAVALLVARVLGLLACGYYITRRAKRVRLNRLRAFKPDWAMQKTILGLGAPASFESGLFQAGRLVTTTFIAAMSTAAIATNVIGGSIVQFINVPGNAFATGVMILVGQKVGRGQFDDIKRTVGFATVLCSLLFGALCLVVFFLRDPIFGMFNPSDAAFAYWPMVIIPNLIATPLFWTTSFVIPAALRATGDVVFPMVVSIATMMLLRVALSYILGVVLGMGVAGVWFAMYADWVARSAFFIPRLLKGKWKGKAITSN